MVVAVVDPHGFGIAGSLEAQLLVEGGGFSVGGEHVHVEPCVT